MKDVALAVGERDRRQHRHDGDLPGFRANEREPGLDEARVLHLFADVGLVHQSTTFTSGWLVQARYIASNCSRERANTSIETAMYFFVRE